MLESDYGPTSWAECVTVARDSRFHTYTAKTSDMSFDKSNAQRVAVRIEQGPTIIWYSLVNDELAVIK